MRLGLLSLACYATASLLRKKQASYIPPGPEIHVVQDMSKASIPQVIVTAPKPIRAVPNKLDYISTTSRKFHPVAAYGPLPRDIEYYSVGPVSKGEGPIFDAPRRSDQKVRIIRDGKE